MKTYLKIKIKSLDEEAKIIKREEKKLKSRGKGQSKVREGLYLHRIKDVREECRATQLAYAFLRKKPYYTVEIAAETQPNWNRIEKMVEKYGLPYFNTLGQLQHDFAIWKKLAYEVIKENASKTLRQAQHWTMQ